MIHQKLALVFLLGIGRSWLSYQKRWWPFFSHRGKRRGWWDTFCVLQTHTSQCLFCIPNPHVWGTWIHLEVPSSTPAFLPCQQTRWLETWDSGGFGTAVRSAFCQRHVGVRCFPCHHRQRSSLWIFLNRLLCRWHLQDYRSTQTGLGESCIWMKTIKLKESFYSKTVKRRNISVSDSPQFQHIDHVKIDHIEYFHGLIITNRT